jgi:hypothetical protein
MVVGGRFWRMGGGALAARLLSFLLNTVVFDGHIALLWHFKIHEGPCRILKVALSTTPIAGNACKN